MADFLNYPYGSTIFEPIRTNLWSIDFSDTPLTEIAKQKVVITARSTSIPELKYTEHIKDYFLNRGMIYSGILDMTNNSWEVSFKSTYDSIDARLIFTEWMKLAFDPNTGAQNFFGTYKGNIKLSLLNLDLSIFKKYMMYNAFPKSISSLNLSYGESTRGGDEGVKVTFAYTHYVEIF